MLVGTAVGLVAGIASTLLVTSGRTWRSPLGVPSAIGLLRVRAGSVTLTVFGNRG